jgi:hypothetical protein
MDRRDRLLFPNPGDRFFGDIVAQVIALLRALGGLDAGRPIEQHREELIHFAAKESRV